MMMVMMVMVKISDMMRDGDYLKAGAEANSFVRINGRVLDKQNIEIQPQWLASVSLAGAKLY